MQGFLLATALILSYIESLIPIPFAVPGMKLGLANLAVVLILTHMGAWEALIINILRIVVSGLLFGSMFGIMFGVSGAVVSFVVMCALHATRRLSVKGVSMGGGVAHNIGQLMVAAMIVHTPGVLYYAPALLISGLVTGYVIGVIAGAVAPALERFMNEQ